MSPKIFVLLTLIFIGFALGVGMDYNRAKSKCLEKFSEATCVNVLR